MRYTPDIIIYHDKCMDGFTAAWACYLRWADGPEYIARNYGMQPDLDAFNRNILIVDFSFPADTLRGLIEQGAKSVVVLDHHKTAQQELEPFAVFKEKPERFTLATAAAMLEDLRRGGYPPILAQFDMDRSGAGLAWDFANYDLGARHRLVDLVEDRDLWKFQYGDDSRHLHLALTSGEQSIERWNSIAGDINGAIQQGAAISVYRDQLVSEIIERATIISIAGEYGIGVDCPYGLASDVGHRLLDEWPDAQYAAAIVRGERSISYSLRSRDDRADVSEIAKTYGGGGHRNAAGFKVPRS